MEKEEKEMLKSKIKTSNSIFGTTKTLCIIAQVILILLKVTDVIGNASWAIVLMPLYLLAFVFIIYISYVFHCCSTYGPEKIREALEEVAREEKDKYLNN